MRRLQDGAQAVAPPAGPGARPGWLSTVGTMVGASGPQARAPLSEVHRTIDLDSPPPAPPRPAPGPTLVEDQAGVASGRRRWIARVRTSLVLLLLDLLAGLAVGAATDVPAAGFLVLLAGMVAAFRIGGLYRRRLGFSVLDDIPYLLSGVVAGVLLSLAVDLSVTGALTGAAAGSRLLVGAALAAVVVAERTVAYAGLRRSRKAGLFYERGLVIGAGHVGIHLVRNLQEHPEYGLVPIGFLDSHPRVARTGDLPAPVLGDYQQLAKVIRELHVTRVIVAFSAIQEAGLVDILRTCDRLDCEISFVPRLYELHHKTRSMDDIWGLPLVHVRRAAFRSHSWKLKRAFDVLAATAGLVVMSPVMLACALAVRLESGPGVLFRQERVGLDDRPFQILKFRTLRPLDDTESAQRWNVSDDSRIGTVGRFLRKTSLDELPQLWNILTGRMSVVGPRPERRHFVSEFSRRVPRYTSRHRVPAGLTGWAQVHGLRGDTSITDRAAFDNAYIENWSLWGDIKIVLRTVGSVVRRTGG